MSRTQSGKNTTTPEQLAVMRGQMVNVIKNKGMSRKKKLLFVALGTFLVFSPVDLMPELILGPVGLVDDAGYVAVVAGFAISAARQKAVAALAKAGA